MPPWLKDVGPWIMLAATVILAIDRWVHGIDSRSRDMELNVEGPVPLRPQIDALNVRVEKLEHVIEEARGHLSDKHSQTLVHFDALRTDVVNVRERVAVIESERARVQSDIAQLLLGRRKE